jgi:hypothetical protein
MEPPMTSLLVMLVTLIVRAAIAEIDGDRESFKEAVEDLTRWALGSGFVLWGRRRLCSVIT